MNLRMMWKAPKTPTKRIENHQKVPTMHLLLGKNPSTHVPKKRE